MKQRIPLLVFALTVTTTALAQKTVYIPDEWKNSSTLYKESDPDNAYTWSKSRSVESDNVIVFWDNGYGSQKPSEVSGSYYVDENALLSKCEEFYQLEIGQLGFVDGATSNLSKYKVMVLMNHTTDWVCYGGGYDFEVSALWLSPSTCKPIGFAVAHEVGHSFHYMCYAEAANHNHTSSSTIGTGFHLPVGSGQTIWEQTAQWQAAQSYPAEMFSQSIGIFRKSHNLAFTHEWHRYQSYWLHYYLCQHYNDITTVAQVWNQPMTGASDFNQALMALKSLSVGDLFRLYYDYAARCATWDFDACASYRSSYIGDFQYRCTRTAAQTYQVAMASTPESTGFNIIPLAVPASGTTLTTHFTALANGALLTEADPVRMLNSSSGFTQHNNTNYLNNTIASQRAFRLGYVALMSDGTRRYFSEDRLYCEGTAETTEDVTMTVPDGVSKLWLVVVPAPKQYVKHLWDDNPQNDEQWPYRFQLDGTDLLTSHAGLSIYESVYHAPHAISDAIPQSWTSKPTPAAQGWTLYNDGVAISWPNSRYESSSSYSQLKNSDGSAFSGNFMFVRWDGTNGGGNVYGFPVSLAANTNYEFSMSATHWNNGTDAGITVSVNSQPNGRPSKRLASQLFTGGGAGNNGANATFVDGTLSFHITEAGTYYITLESPSSAALYAIANMQLTAVNPTAASGYEVNNEGAWCWFADPRALHYKNAAGTINATYIGYIDVHGNVKATQYDWRTGRKADVLVRSYFQPDDHNNPTFVVLPDERVMIFYTRHTDEAKIWYRISKKPGDITQLGDEKYLATANNTTYPSPFILSDDPEHIYLCWRGIKWHPTIARITMPDADDNCSFDYGPLQIVQSTGARPYCKYQSNGKDKIYLCYTTGHPDNEQPNWLYFNVIDINEGNGPILRDIAGTQLSVVADGVFNVNKTSDYLADYPNTVVDHTSGIRNWVWQIALDSDENPVIAFPHINDDKLTHSYYYGRWTGSEWQSTFVQYGGHAFHKNWNSTEKCYSGGMAIDPDNVNTLYLSVPTKDGAYNRDGVYEIWKYTMNSEGHVTSSAQVTAASEKNNVRPFILPGSASSPMRLVWMHGDYYYWMVKTSYPDGYPTAIHADYAWPETVQNTADGALEGLSLASGKSLMAVLAMNASSYSGTLLASADGTFSYSLDGSTNYPSVTINGTSYRSQNRLLTSDDWATTSTGTKGDNHPTKLTTWVLTLTYDGERLTTYRNGLVDQVIEVEGLNATDIQTAGDGFNQTCLAAKTLNLAMTALTTMQESAQLLESTLSEQEEAALEALSLPSTTRTDLVLPTVALGQTITWASSNTAVLNTDGCITFPDVATAVTLTATCGSSTRDFTVTVQTRDIAQNLRYEQTTALDQTANTASGFATNTYGLAPEGLLTGLRSFTVLLKANVSTATTLPRLYDFGSGSGNSVFLRAGSTALTAGIKYNGGTTTMVTGSTILDTHTDYCLAVTFDAATKTTRIYVNGEEDVAGTNNQNEPYMLAAVAADTRNYIGRTQWWDTNSKNSNQDFCGTISDLQLYDVALTRQEICQLQDIEYVEPQLPTSLDNADFEGSYTVLSGSGVSSDRAIYVPEGWTVTRTNGNVNDLTALKSGDLYYSNFFASLAQPENGGSQTYWIRQRTGTPTLKLSQTKTFAAGTYKLTADVWQSGLGGEGHITITPDGGEAQQSSALTNKTEWQQVTMEFTSDGTTPITIDLVARHTSDGSEKIIGFDNIVLTKQITLDDTQAFTNAAPVLADVTYPRQLLSGWNTLCLPFDCTAEELGASKVGAFMGTDANDAGVLKFESVTTLEAGKPYLVYMDADGAAELTFPARHINAQPEPIDVTDAQNGAYTFRGLFAPIAKGNTTIVAGDYIIGEQGFRSAAGGNASKAFRAFIVNDRKEANVKQSLSVSFDGGVPTAIYDTPVNDLQIDTIYDLQGRKVINRQLPRGIYVKNSKKFIIK